MKYGGCTYMVKNKNNTVIYIGVTSALRARIWQHKTKFYPKCFTAKYNRYKIVGYESFPGIVEAIDREKQLKAERK